MSDTQVDSFYEEKKTCSEKTVPYKWVFEQQGNISLYKKPVTHSSFLVMDFYFDDKDLNITMDFLRFSYSHPSSGFSNFGMHRTEDLYTRRKKRNKVIYIFMIYIYIFLLKIQVKNQPHFEILI